jgi:HSP20 family protein
MVDAGDPWEEFRRFEEMMNRMFEEFWGRPMRRLLPPSGRPLLPGERALAPAEYRMPYVDVVETDKEVIATAEMPGLEKQDIKINLTEDRLEISSEAKREEERKEKGYMYRERRYGGYYRSISLPARVNPDNSKATYNNGVLEIKMPKTEVKEKKLLSVE